MTEKKSSFCGIVTHRGLATAEIWVEKSKENRLIDLDYRQDNFDVGDWLKIKGDHILDKITPLLTTRVTNDGIVQVKTEVIFDDEEMAERIGSVVAVNSADFGKVAAFAPFDTIPNIRYEVFVERIPNTHRTLEVESGLHWFIPMDQKPKPVRDFVPSISQSTEKEEIGPFDGVIVSKTPKSVFVWTPSLGEGICYSGTDLQIGNWISFKAKMFIQNLKFNINVGFCVTSWQPIAPLLKAIAVNNSVELITTVYVDSMGYASDTLRAKWVEAIMDRDGKLKNAVRQFGHSKTYKVAVKRVKKSVQLPVTAWTVVDVQQKNSTTIGVSSEIAVKKVGYVCEISSTECIFVVDGITTKYGRRVKAKSRIFTPLPKLGVWYNLELTVNNQFWVIISGEMTEPLYHTRVRNELVEIETEITLTGGKIGDACRAISEVLGDVIVERNILPVEFYSRKSSFKVWCITRKPEEPGYPTWKVSTLSRPHLKDVSNNSPESRKGIVVGESLARRYIWTPELGEGFCENGQALVTGDWIEFTVCQERSSECRGNVHYIADKWRQIEDIFPARRAGRSVIVEMELEVPADWPAEDSCYVEFFGKVIDRKKIFKEYLHVLRGHIITLLLRREKNENGSGAVWVIIDIKIKSRVLVGAGRPEKENNCGIEVKRADSPSLFPESYFEVKKLSSDSKSTNLFEKEYREANGRRIESDMNSHREPRGDIYDKTDAQTMKTLISKMRSVLKSEMVRETVKILHPDEYAVLSQYF